MRREIYNLSLFTFMVHILILLLTGEFARLCEIVLRTTLELNLILLLTFFIAALLTLSKGRAQSIGYTGVFIYGVCLGYHGVIGKLLEELSRFYLPLSSKVPDTLFTPAITVVWILTIIGGVETVSIDLNTIEDEV